MRTHVFASILILTIAVGLSIAPVMAASTKAQSFLSVKGTSIVDSTGKPVILRGVNYPGYERGSLDPAAHSESAYAMFARYGFNVVRLPISWGNLEPVAGSFRESYLKNFVDKDIRWAKKYGLYIVLDMHQDNWAQRFGGNGAPGWSVSRYPATELGMRQAVSDFWANSAINDHLVNVWTKVARRYANEPTIAGYDILNEPWIYTSVNPNLGSSNVQAFYVKVIRSVRTVDPNHIFFLEPANLHEYKFPIKEQIVWSPHFYTLAYARHYYPSNASLLMADVAGKYQKFAMEMGTPVWIGEFGAFMNDRSAQDWVQDAVNAFDKYQMGWAWWAYMRRAGPIPTPLYS